MLVAKAQTTVQSGTRTGMYENCTRAPSGRHHPYGTDESDVPRTFLFHAGKTANEKNAPYHHQTAMPVPGRRHQAIRQAAGLSEISEAMSIRARNQPYKHSADIPRHAAS